MELGGAQQAVLVETAEDFCCDGGEWPVACDVRTDRCPAISCSGAGAVHGRSGSSPGWPGLVPLLSRCWRMRQKRDARGRRSARATRGPGPREVSISKAAGQLSSVYPEIVQAPNNAHSDKG